MNKNKNYERIIKSNVPLDVLNLLPSNEDLESIIISIMIEEPSLINKIDRIFKTSNVFSNNTNKVIYDTIVEINNENREIILSSLINKLNKRNVKTSDFFDIKNSLDEGFSQSSLRYINDWKNLSYELFGYYIQRLLFKVTYKSFELCKLNSINVEKIISYIETTTNKINDVYKRIDNKNNISVDELVDNTILNIEKTKENIKKYGKSGYTLGNGNLDKLTQGSEKGDLIIIAARPSMGKTAMAINIMKNLLKENIPIALYSLEMTYEKQMKRLLLSCSNINENYFKLDYKNEKDETELTKVSNELKNKTYSVEDEMSGFFSILRDIKRKRKMKKWKKNMVVIIDYFQLMIISRKYGFSKEERISYMTRQMKILAKELGIPIIALSQLNRALESRANKNKKPQLSDLRDSGAIEQDADKVIFIFRPSVYGITEDKNGNDISNYGEWIVAKNREGEIGTINFWHNNTMTKFENWDNKNKDSKNKETMRSIEWNEIDDMETKTEESSNTPF